MHPRRLAAFLVGVWLSCSVFMGWVATNNLTSVPDIVHYPGARMEAEVKELGAQRTEVLLRFHSAELNRFYFRWWERFQVPLGIALAALLLFSTNGNRLIMTLATGMVAMVIAQHLVLSPQILEMGRSLDFVPPGEITKERTAFRTYHGYYSTLEVLKLGMGLGLAVRLMYSSKERPRRSRSSRKAAEPAVTNSAS